MIRPRALFSSIARARWRRRYISGIVAGLVLTATVLYAFVHDAMVPAGFATPAAAYVSLSGAVSWGFYFHSLIARYRSRLVGTLVIGCLFGSGAGVMVLGFSLASWHLVAPAAAALAVCGTLIGGAFSIAMTRIVTQRALAWSIRHPVDRRAAQETYRASQYAMKTGRLSAEKRKVARLNAARAAIVRSYGDDAPDGLVEATDELDRLLKDPPDDWMVPFAAAMNLVDAISTKAGKQGDVSGYPRALQSLTEAAERLPPDAGARAVVHDLRADYHAIIADRLPSGPEADEHVAVAIAALRAAINSVTPAIRGMLPGLYAKLGVFLAYGRAGPGDLETGIAHCRTAVQLAGRSRRARALAWRSLANLLIDRALETVANLPANIPRTVLAAVASDVHATLAEAERIVRRARRHGGFDGRAEAAALLAQVQTERAMFLHGPGDDRRAARAWRAAARAAALSDPLDRVRIGQDWAAWAMSTQDVTWCAEAYGYLMSAVPSAVAVRYLADERDKVLTGVQSTAEEAGYWLAKAGQPGEAAIALDLGRAVSLSEVLGREQPELATALSQAGRLDLLERYREALEAHGAPAAPAHDEGLTSTAQRAWASYDIVVREIADVTGIGLPGARLTLAELAKATIDGPVVYLAAAASSGYAVVVPTVGPPTYWPLPQLTKADVADWVKSFLQRPDRAGVAAVVQWLWTAGIGVLAQELPDGAIVTIVPVGLLSLLPVHAAGGPTAPGQAPADWAYLADRVTVRYVPNVRILLHTRGRATALPPDAVALLAVAAPDGDPRRPLPHTVREVIEIARPWAQASTITDGALTAVKTMLADHTVWHFACHCEATPDRILDSALLLTHAQVTLRTILAMQPKPRRLAILSACETHVSGTQLPDEAIGLPAGLLQAGFAGVIASHWTVGDRSAAFLMTRFHDLWHGQGLSPAAALAEAQRWLRTATYADLHAYLDGILALPADQSAAGWARWCAVRPYGHPYHWAPFALTGH